MVCLSLKHLRTAQPLLCVIFLLVIAVGPGVLKAEQLGCEYECLLKQVDGSSASCCDKSAAVHGVSHNGDSGQQGKQNRVVGYCGGGPCYGSSMDVRGAAAVSNCPVETENSEAVCQHFFSAVFTPYSLSGHSAIRQLPFGTPVPIYKRTCVYLI